MTKLIEGIKAISGNMKITVNSKESRHLRNSTKISN
jgi:hypothetical protein